MSKKIIWTPESEKTFASILFFLEKEWNTHVLLSFIDKVEQVINLISEKPELYQLIDKEKHLHRCVLVKQITLYYKVNQNHIDLITFWDNRQDPSKLKL